MSKIQYSGMSINAILEADTGASSLIYNLANRGAELECENARLNSRINNLLLPMQHRLIERNERMMEALEAAWYAMERHAPQLCRREAATARQILENCGRLPTLSHEPKN
jgi:hypothetical protein